MASTLRIDRRPKHTIMQSLDIDFFNLLASPNVQVTQMVSNIAPLVSQPSLCDGCFVSPTPRPTSFIQSKPTFERHPSHLNQRHPSHLNQHDHVTAADSDKISTDSVKISTDSDKIPRTMRIPQDTPHGVSHPVTPGRTKASILQASTPLLSLNQSPLFCVRRASIRTQNRWPGSLICSPIPDENNFSGLEHFHKQSLAFTPIGKRKPSTSVRGLRVSTRNNIPSNQFDLASVRGVRDPVRDMCHVPDTCHVRDTCHHVRDTYKQEPLAWISVMDFLQGALVNDLMVV